MNPLFQRHRDACQNFTLPGDRLALRIAGAVAGWVEPGILAALQEFDSVTRDADGLTLRDPAALPDIAHSLSQQGFYRYRHEAFDVRAESGGKVLSTIDRGAMPAFGIMAAGMHLNGLVRRADGLHLWVARRAADKALDPGKLDHLAAGGVSAGMTPWETLIKEGAEEAAIPPELAMLAKQTARFGYTMLRPEGLRRDVLYCYDLKLPESFMPRAADGEVESFELWPIARVFEAVRDCDEFKFNVSLVLIDLFERLGMNP